ncbi:MAG: signal peptidase II [Acidobacteria bacterium]|nr:signal peptidase II [Acidobacteriota bacterium]
MISRAARFAIAAMVFAGDRLSKHWIEQNVSGWDTFVVIPNVFNIVHAQNRGAAFGLFNQTDGWWRPLFLIGVSTLVLAFVGVQLWRMPRSAWPGGNLTPVALALVLGGASGNLFDRLWRGSVTDFLQVFIGSFEWPSFNLADSAISIGACLLVLTMAKASRQAAA